MVIITDSYRNSFSLQYYETKLAEAKSRKESLIAKAVETAVSSRMQDLQSKIKKCSEEKDVVANVGSFSFNIIIWGFTPCMLLRHSVGCCNPNCCYSFLWHCNLLFTDESDSNERSRCTEGKT